MIQQHLVTISVGIILGVLARLYMLRIDYRQYPSYPHGFVTHLSLGFIAAALGAVAVPAIAKPDYTAVTFLALAAQQFREVRNIERETLSRLDQMELVPRGFDYIEGIARVFEARNYLVMATALGTSLATYFLGWVPGVVTGIILILFFGRLMRGEWVRDIAEVVPGQVHFDGAFLKVNQIVIMNVGLPAFREKILKEGLGVVLKPKDDNARATLNTVGQRQAILHVAAALLGSKKEIGEPEFNPLARKDIDTGEIAIFLLPNEPDIECLVEAVGRVPVLESAKRMPLSTGVSRSAAD